MKTLALATVTLAALAAVLLGASSPATAETEGPTVDTLEQQLQARVDQRIRVHLSKLAVEARADVH